MATSLSEIMAAGSFLPKGNTATTKLFYTVWMQFASYFLQREAQASPRHFVPVWPRADEKLHPQTFQLGCPWGKVEQMRTCTQGHVKVPHLNGSISFFLLHRKYRTFGSDYWSNTRVSILPATVRPQTKTALNQTQPCSRGDLRGGKQF